VDVSGRTTAEIVADLRPPSLVFPTVVIEAADRLTELEAEVERLNKVVDELMEL